MARSRNWQLPLGAVVLILIGVVFLLQNLGALPWSLWPTLLRLWPVLLIALGVRLILGRGLVASLIVAALLILALAGAAAIALVQTPLGKSAQERIQEARRNSESLEANLRVGAGRLEVGALPEGSADLVTGEFSGGARSSLRRRGTTAVLDVGFGPSWLPWQSGLGGDGALRLSRDVPIELKVDAGAADLLLDLRDLQVTQLDLNTGASKVEVKLPARVPSGTVEIDAGATNITLIVPQGVAARIRADNPLSSLDVDEARFPKKGKVFESPDFGTAERRLNIGIDVAAASVTVR